MSKGAKQKAVMRCYCRLIALALWAVVAVDRSAVGDDKGDVTAQHAANVARLTKVIESYSVAIGDDKPEGLELVRSPVLLYSDTISPVADGVVFVWTKAGRPEVVMAAHDGTQGRTSLEFKSLSLRPVTATWKGRVEWATRTPGVEFTPVEGAPAPDSSAPKRLSQMRSIMQSFSASVEDKKLGRQELRRLSQPLVRYAQAERGLLDGGVFAFVLTTNPEFLVVVEGQTIDGQPRWVYSPARFTGRQCELRLNNQPVWPHGDLPSTRDPAAPFFQLRKLVPENGE